MSQNPITGHEEIREATPSALGPTAGLQLFEAMAGGDSPVAFDYVVSALTGTKGLRQGAIRVQLTRDVDNPIVATWDGNPDACLKMITANYANNLDGATRIGGARVLDIQARNRGTNLSWVKAVEINGRNDSGKNVTDLVVAHLRAENYGNVYTDTTVLDLELSDENVTQAQERTGLLIRSTDQSAQAAATAAIKISHTSANGWAALFNFAGATGDSVAVGSLKGSGGSDILCVDRIAVKYNGATRYLPLYDTVV